MSFNLTRKTDYALVALATLARETGEDSEPQSARQIAERCDLPLPLLMNALKELHRANIICSRRGVGGGYYLCREPGDISLKQVIEALEGPINITLCSEAQSEDNQICRIVSLCQISTPMRKLNWLLVEFLAGVTLKHLVEDETLLAHPRPHQEVSL